jgi:hypothetical protein
MTKAKIKRVVMEMRERAMWWDADGLSFVTPTLSLGVATIFDPGAGESVHLEGSNRVLAWLIIAEGVRIGALP